MVTPTDSTVTAVASTFIFTPGTEELFDPVLSREYIGPHFPERIGEPVDVAGLSFSWLPRQPR